MALLGPTWSMMWKKIMKAKAVPRMATAPMAAQAAPLMGSLGHSSSVGTAKPNAAPIWLPVVMASGLTPSR